ncbi:hypothetical protein T10_4102 [Trichinella papuae]|uniref:PiggyBac transposable element-derived protein domain-containing protein n=1 Tax=Trichinella papuae TaxID=268474 RepID=A0A0V1MAN6_9BILA|nr:hypothetical protein T10_4102 [Trichinella papuae]
MAEPQAMVVMKTMEDQSLFDVNRAPAACAFARNPDQEGSTEERKEVAGVFPYYFNVSPDQAFDIPSVLLRLSTNPRILTQSGEYGQIDLVVVVFPDADISELDIKSDEEQVIAADDYESLSSESSVDSVEVGISTLWTWIKQRRKQTDVTWKGSFKKYRYAAVHLEVEKIPEPIEYFKQFFSNEIYDVVAEESTKHGVYSAVLPIPFSSDNMDQYMGIFLKMGVSGLPRYRMYWS